LAALPGKRAAAFFFFAIEDLQSTICNAEHGSTAPDPAPKCQHLGSVLRVRSMTAIAI
jgi:hypothetical protein